MRRLLLALACLLWASTASAQTVVPANQPVTLAWDSDGVNVSGFKVYVDDAAPILVPASDRSVKVTLASGTHTIVVSAYNPDAETKSPALSQIAKQPAPNAPTQLRFIVTADVAPDGTVSNVKVTKVN